MEKNEENKLRECIREIIHFTLRKQELEKTKVLQEENKLREIIRNIIILETDTPDNDPAPSRSTGISILEDLLKKIIPVLETDY